MISRGAEEYKDVVTLSGTTSGTMIGSYLFYRVGAQKDRLAAIRQITGSTEDPNVRTEKLKQEKIQAELEKQKRELEEQKKEIKELQKKIKQQP